MQNTAKLVLWGVKGSPYVQKVMVALAEKNLDYEHRQILPKSLLILRNEVVPEEFDRLSPLGKIPVLQMSDCGIADSAVITAFLDRQFPSDKKLYPDNPKEYAKALWFERYADTTLTDVVHKKIFLQKVIKPALLNQPTDLAIVERATSSELPPLLTYLDQALERNDWLADQRFSMADTAVVVQLLSLKKADVSLDDWKNLDKYIKRVVEQPSFLRVM